MQTPNRTGNGGGERGGVQRKRREEGSDQNVQKASLPKGTSRGGAGKISRRHKREKSLTIGLLLTQKSRSGGREQNAGAEKGAGKRKVGRGNENFLSQVRRAQSADINLKSEKE